MQYQFLALTKCLYLFLLLSAAERQSVTYYIWYRAGTRSPSSHVLFKRMAGQSIDTISLPMQERMSEMLYSLYFGIVSYIFMLNPLVSNATYSQCSGFYVLALVYMQ